MADFSLFRLTGAYLQLQDKLASDPDADVQDTLDSIKDAAGDKLDGCQYVIGNFETQNAGLKAERDRLNKRIKQNDTAVTRLKAYMQSGVEALGGKVKTERYTYSLRHSKKVVLTPGYTYAPEYMKPAEPSKSAIAAALKTGHEVPGAELVENVGLGVR